MINQLATSLQYVNVIVTALDGDPTGDPVQVAFTAPGAGPQPADWNAAGWDTAVNAGTNQYMARCLVGPGGTVQLTPGLYRIWVKVTGSTEIPQLPAGFITIT